MYVVATPIGNLEDISTRGLRILGEVDLILAEDTRHSVNLLRHFGIETPLKSLHEFNEREIVPLIADKLRQGRNLALISDAGTPLISDPGYQLVHTLAAEGIRVVPIPGPSAIITALSVGGLSTARFVFEGFVPSNRTGRQKVLKSLAYETRTLVLFEAPHRIVAFLEDAADAFGGDRDAVLARELTKKFETIYRGSLGELRDKLKTGEDDIKGEFVVMIAGYKEEKSRLDLESARVLKILLAHSLTVREAAAIAAEITGARKNTLYKQALELEQERRANPSSSD